MYYKPIVIKITWYRHQNRHREQERKLRNTITAVNFSSAKVPRSYNGERTVSSIVLEQLDIYIENDEVRLLEHLKSISSKWMKDPNIRPGTKGARRNIGLHDISLGNDILDRTQKAQATKSE